MKFKLKPEELQRIARVVNVEKGKLYCTLGYTFDLETGELCDLLYEDVIPGREAQVLTILLAHYTSAEATVKTEKIVKLGDLPGGHTYEKAFMQRAV